MATAKEAIRLLETLGYVAEQLKAMPKLQPLAAEILGPVFLNGTGVPVPKVRHVSAATRAKMRAAAAKRWGKKGKKQSQRGTT